MPNTTDFRYACRALGIDLNDASRALHKAKKKAGLRGDDDCDFDLQTGDISFNGDSIGNLND